MQKLTNAEWTANIGKRKKVGILDCFLFVWLRFDQGKWSSDVICCGIFDGVLIREPVPVS
jgi:hypothetical protein